VTGAGFVKIIDIKKNKISSKYDICSDKAAFDVDWNSQGVMVACEDAKV
jgi:hypothetical protein